VLVVTEEREESGDGRERRPTRVSLPKRLVRFLQEVVAELRKVIWPSRKQLVTYTLVVLVFVSFMVALVALLDFLVGQGVNALFGA
jgi:preprotein translocase subunit SecE